MEHELTPDDIRVREEQRQPDACRWPHEVSLRSYLEILYYCDDGVRPPMRIFIGGVGVEPRNWSHMLQHRQEAKAYYPHVDAQTNGGERAVARLDLGYAVPLQELVTLLQGGDPYGAPGGRSSSHAELVARKKQLVEYSGVFYYHRGRLIAPLQALPCFSKADNRLPTAERRIRDKGFGLLGVCRENFLTPRHNKASYMLRETVDSAAPKPELLFKRMSELAEEHLSTVVAPMLSAILGQQAPSSSSSQAGPSSGQPASMSVRSVRLPPGFEMERTARGDNYYVGPGGKQFRSFREVERYLDRQSIHPQGAKSQCATPQNPQALNPQGVHPQGVTPRGGHPKGTKRRGRQTSTDREEEEEAQEEEDSMYCDDDEEEEGEETETEARAGEAIEPDSEDGPANITPSDPEEEWVECVDCKRWRRLTCASLRALAPKGGLVAFQRCRDNPDPSYASCEVPQELSNEDIDALLGIAPSAPAPTPTPAAGRGLAAVPLSRQGGDAQASIGPSQLQLDDNDDDGSAAPVEMEILKVEVELEGEDESEGGVERLQAVHVHVEQERSEAARVSDARASDARASDARASDAALRAAHSEAVRKAREAALARKESEAQRTRDAAQAQRVAEDTVVEDTWMVSAKDGRKGYVVRAGRWKGQQLFQLREQSGSLGAKKYGVHDLSKETLDVTREQKVAAPLATLEGSSARMWWRSSQEEGRDAAGDFWAGVLRESYATPGVAGTFALCYQDDLTIDELAVFVQPDGGYVVHRVDDGEPILREEIILDRWPYPYPVALPLALTLILTLTLTLILTRVLPLPLPLTWTGTPWPPRWRPPTLLPHTHGHRPAQSRSHSTRLMHSAATLCPGARDCCYP